MIVSRNDLISEIINFTIFLLKNKNIWKYIRKILCYRKTITVHQNNTNYESKALDIDENGALYHKKGK